ncbi:MAG: biotin--[acetyl-CoA-carboxylase] ligase [Candidatus Subteraquimicrobiales bacterium]|nr:biotin--[acetyl-CoA-carboxylase] ligase [Candidatus Subteraquimicrobiales bacterium]
MSTKDSVLSFLRKSKIKHISGEEISKHLSLSRTAIWKAIQTLKEEGYKIDASPRLGYRLIQAPDLLLPLEIKQNLSTRILGSEIHHFNEVGSTNNLAKDLARRGAVEGTLVIAERQSLGKGRFGRHWVSPSGGLWFSLILKPEILPLDAPKVTLLAGVAITETIQKTLGLNARIKWPNDLLIDGKKVAGLLTEMSAEIDRVDFIILGIGINVNVDITDFPRELRSKVTSLKEALSRKVDRIDFLKSLLVCLERYYLELKEGKTESILSRWKELNDTLGAYVKVSSLEEEIVGEALSLDEHGGLILRLESGEKRVIYSGEIC